MAHRTRRGLMISFLLAGRGLSPIQQESLEQMKKEPPKLIATWYGPEFDGREMACGEPFKMGDPSIAAHRTLRIGAELELRNPANGRRLRVVIKDRMAEGASDEMIDLSLAGAKWLRFDLEGRAVLEVISQS